jgi:hypothetical protein
MGWACQDYTVRVHPPGASDIPLAFDPSVDCVEEAFQASHVQTALIKRNALDRRIVLLLGHKDVDRTQEAHEEESYRFANGQQ